MSEFTYETNERKEKLEDYEWDNTWIEMANDSESSRVLYIGDSISCGTRKIATEKSGNVIKFDGFGTSKGIDNPFLLTSIKTFAMQQPKRDYVIFNNGLHGWHLDDKTEYKENYDRVLGELKEFFGNTPIAIVLTTFIKDETRIKRVEARNAAALELADKYGFKVIDLFSVSKANSELISGDGVHLTREGYEKLAEEILKTVKND